MRKKALIKVSGTVQGVGFRPFVYRTAGRFGIKGYVKNLGDAGVEILAEGTSGHLEEFIKAIRKDPPVNARINSLTVEWQGSVERTDGFHILPSGGTGSGGTIPPDYGICSLCAKEASSVGERRYRYPLTSCTDCGPRYTILEEIPLDRKNTSYAKFPPCSECSKEYRDPADRRFHAQTIACPRCGPKYFLLDVKGRLVPSPVETAIERLRAGKIVAIKGAGGIHLSCMASDDDAVAEMRRRRGREQKPFAVMSDLEDLKKYAHVSGAEKTLLTSKERPIVVLRKKNSARCLSDLVAPGLDSVGVMLPYTALHQMIFSVIDSPLVMTSANRHAEPMIIGNDEIIRQKAADCYLLHDLEIKNRCDDSVLKIVNKNPVFIRRSRGFVPSPVDLKNPDKNTVLALGAEENDTFCLLKGGNAFQSQHIGNTVNLSTMGFMEEAIERSLKIIAARPDVIACDLHPDFNTGRLAAEFGKRFDAQVIKVQHHHAHLLSLSGEHNLDEMVGICCDGVGYGLDGKAWGGEVFSLKGGLIQRVGHLKEQPMPGGDLAARYPARIVAGMLYDSYEQSELREILEKLSFRHGKKEIVVVLRQLEKGVNVQPSTSAGRVFDAVSALLGICHERTYEGEPALKLEAAGNGGRDLGFPVKIRDGVVDTSALLKAVAESVKKFKTRDIAYSFEKTFATGLAQVAVEEAEREDIKVVGVSGGVAYNGVFVGTVAGHVKERGLNFVQNRSVPCGDGGISYGQAAYVSAL